MSTSSLTPTTTCTWRPTARGRLTIAACSSSSAPSCAARSAGPVGAYRNGFYAGVTPRFRGALDAICGPAERRPSGLDDCGKGEPGQVMSSPTAPAGALRRRAGRRGMKARNCSTVVTGRTPEEVLAITDRDEPLERPSARRALLTARRRPPSCATLAALALRGLAPTRPRRSTDLTVSVLCVDQGHTGRRRPTRRPTRRCATSPRAPGPPRAPRREPPASRATTRGCRRGARPRTTASTRAPRSSTRRRGEALSVAFERSAAAGLQAFGIWTAGAVDTAIASSTGVRALDSVTDAFMKVIARHESGGRAGRPGRGVRSPRSTRRAGHARGGQGHP